MPEQLPESVDQARELVGSDAWSLLVDFATSWQFKLAAALLVGLLLLRWGRRLRTNIRYRGLLKRVKREDAERKAALHAQTAATSGVPELRHAEAAKIIATSSAGGIAGYEIVRQIEAVFVDGFRRPEESLEGLKAVAAMKGANAVANVRHERSSSGRYSASGDAVVVRPIEADVPASRAEQPGQPESEAMHDG